MSRLLERLRKYKDDRGMMANLRCILVDNKKHRAWPALNRLGVGIENDIASWVAGLYATHPEITSEGNFGITCKAIEKNRREESNKENKLTSTERRFQHLLAAERGAELNARVLRLVLMAKSQGVPINYEQLEIDMRYWGDSTKIEWARSYWTQGTEPLAEEDI
ncbi:MAG: type I-E CRISPR-associated protein Cse2/CasB [Deltaproteobacteria bacterium]|nr:type I-E CRISPR-associated protein Cse2/CasB [Deltaproteobacteria bacterium]